MRVRVDGDMIAQIGTEIPPAEGVFDLPAEMRDVPRIAMRHDGKKFVDARGRSSFYIDDEGRKHIQRLETGWPKVTCAFEDPLIRDAAGWRSPTASEVLAPTIKAECARRINDVLKDTVTQLNMTAAAVSLSVAIADGDASAEDQATFDLLKAGQKWVRDMQAECRALIDAADDGFASDESWPPAPEGLADLAAQF